MRNGDVGKIFHESFFLFFFLISQRQHCRKFCFIVHVEAGGIESVYFPARS